MKRYSQYRNTRFDDPFWQTVRLCVDVLGRKAARTESQPLKEGEIYDALVAADTSASRAFVRFLDANEKVLHNVGHYLQERQNSIEIVLAMLRDEDEAKQDLINLAGSIDIATYGTQSQDHHQSSKVTVASVNWLTAQALAGTGVDFEPNPQARGVSFSAGHMFVTPRRLDGAIPALLNPVGLWEIKEYWGGTSGGSKMSDAIYECQLVGTEMRMYEDRSGTSMLHYLIFDGLQQWKSRRSDIARAFDLLSSGLIDELIVGSEVMTEWPRVVRQMAALAPTDAAASPARDGLF